MKYILILLSFLSFLTAEPYHGALGNQEFSIEFPFTPKGIQEEDYFLLDAGDETIHYYVDGLNFSELTPPGASEPLWNHWDWVTEMENTNKLSTPLTPENIQIALNGLGEFHTMVFGWSTDHFITASRTVVKEGQAYLINAAVFKTHDPQKDRDNNEKISQFVLSFNLEK